MLESHVQKKLDQAKKVEGYLVPGQERALFMLAASLKAGSTIVEIGTYLGKSTACMALGASENTEIYTIDTFEGNKIDFLEGSQFVGGNFYKKFERNMKRLGIFNKIHPVKGLSGEIGKKWNIAIDLLFIDGSHAYEDVKNDFELFYPWVKPGGIVAFHDVTEQFPGVLKVWQKYATKKLSSTYNVKTLFFGIKNPKKHSTTDQKRLEEIIEGKENKVFAILPVHNRLKQTKRCLTSFEKQSYKNLEVIIVNDGSNDGTSKFIKENYPHHKIIRGNGNWWWTKSMYKGVEYVLAKAQAGDFVLSMNNDCFFKKDYLKNIVSESKKNRRAIVGSLILDAHNPKKIIDAGVKIHWPTNLIYAVSENISDKLSFYSDRKIISDIDTLPGKGSLIPIETFYHVGNFNYKLLPHYLGDYEFFSRANQKGESLIVSSKSRLYNFSELTGSYKKEKDALTYKETFHLLFGRKSKNNIVDYATFLILRSPKRYLLRNLYDLLLRALSYVPAIYKIKLAVHNIPIYVRQNKITRKFLLLLHNIPIYIKQNYLTRQIALSFRKLFLLIKQSEGEGRKSKS